MEALKEMGEFTGIMEEMEIVYGKLRTELELREHCMKNMKMLVLPVDGELLIDLDSKDIKTFRFDILKMLVCILNVTHRTCWRSQSKRWHISIRTSIKDMSPELRSTLQGALGSDPQREVLAMRSVIEGKGVPSCLFRPVGAEVFPLSDKL